MTPSPTQSNVLAALRSFLLGVLPAGVGVYQAQQNRVPEPQEADFVIMTPLRSPRLATNVDDFTDVQFTGAITLAVLTVSAVLFGVITPGATLFGTGVALNTIIGTQIAGTPGGTGTYNVSVSQTLASATLAAGQTEAVQELEEVVQLDVHGPNSADNANVISTLMRDPYAYDQFAAQDPNYGVTPLYADDPQQRPFINDQDQYEWRWVIEARLQANVAVLVPQQAAAALAIDVVSVDATYPP